MHYNLYTSNHLGNEISEFKERVAICNRLKAMIYAGDLNFNKDDIDHLCCALRFFIDNSHTLTIEHLHVMRKLHNLKTETAV